MKKTNIAIVGLSSFAMTAMASAADKATTVADLGLSGPDFLKDTEVFLNGRLRGEYADLAAAGDESSVLSLRHKFGFKTPEFAGFRLLAEGEHNWILTKSTSYSAFPGGPRSIIADPDNFDLNRLQLSYDLGENTTFIVGRQNINQGDQRFIGAVGWRQNDQTFDAATVSNTSFENLKLSYSYANQVNRIFGTQAPASALERWHGDVHLLRAEYSGLSVGDISAFGYLLDFDNAAANSSNTYGVELKGSQSVSGNLPELNYLVTAAVQEDAGANPATYEEYYLRAELSMKGEAVQGGIGAEQMTSDGTSAFQFPLGTNHKFGGYADAFLGTPANGLRDYHVWVGSTCPLGVKHKLAVHYFTTDEQSQYLGYEIDYVAKKKLTDNASVLVKFAHLEGHGVTRDVERASVQLDYKF